MTWTLIIIACLFHAAGWLVGLLRRWCSMRAFVAAWSGFGVSFVLLLFAAARAELNRPPSTIVHQPLVVDHSRLTASDLPSTADGLPFVASSIKQTYHLRGCRYAGMMEHVRTYATREEAEAAGLTPCKVCLPAISTVANKE